MEQIGAQTEKITSYETTRTRRSLVDENIHNGDSNDGSDEEFASSGFYVREKTVDKNSKNNIDENGGSSPLQNGKNGDCNQSTHDCDDSNDIVQNPSDTQAEGNNQCNLKDIEGQNDSETNNENEAEQKSKTDLKEEDKITEVDLKVTEKNNTEKENLHEQKFSHDKEEMDNKASIKKNECESEKTKDATLNKFENEESKKDCESDKKTGNCKVSSVNEKKDIKKDTLEENEDKREVDEKQDVKDNLIEEKNDNREVSCVDEKEDSKDDMVEEKNDTKEVSCVNEKEVTKDNMVEEKNDTKEVSCVSEKEDTKDNMVEENNDKEISSVDEKENTKGDMLEEKKDNSDVSCVSEKENVKDNTLGEKKDNSEVTCIDDTLNETKDNKSKENDEVIEVLDDEKDDIEKKPNRSKREERKRSILKGELELTKTIDENDEMEMDDDFDPSLLCPDISMDVDEAPVITNNDEAGPSGGTTSPLPYEPMFSELVDEITGAEVQIDLTPEEMEMRRNMFGPDNPVQESKVHCTACNVHLGSALIGANNRFVHPLLKVLICKNCYHFYTSGEFEKDEDGSELYCRWCGQGGQVLCCSSCEFVFCKRCIRNNFGIKKFKEIRDSDDWNCFRCNPGQLSNLRAACAEFMEYYRNEMARVQSVCESNPTVMTTDYTKCCGGSEKKTVAPVPTRTTKRKRLDEDDPDYSPMPLTKPEEPPKKKVVVSAGSEFSALPSSISVRPLAPKPPTHQVIRPVLMQTGPRPSTSQPQLLKIGNTTFKVKSPGGPGYTVQKAGQAAQRTNVSPGFIKIVPQRMQSPRPSPTSYTVVSGTNSGKPTFTTVRPPPLASKPVTSSANSTNMKHEWFEKTVRAAARVNSNLSYTLTQLNRQQSTAASVEALAVVHNKLQEVLSTSINSLIQIRKNLRTEFIAGIKHYKFPPKPAPTPPAAASTTPIVVKDDDDVIFINPAAVAKNLPPPPPLALSPAIRITKKSAIEKPKPKPSSSTNTITITSTNANPPKGGFLKVRSFTSLQSVPSECITIPDDPPEEDPLAVNAEGKNKKQELSKSSVSVESAAVNDAPIVIDDDMDHLVYNVNDKPSAQIQKMMNMVVVVKRSRVVDEIIRAKGLLKSENKEKKTEVDKSAESRDKNGKKESDSVDIKTENSHQDKS